MNGLVTVPHNSTRFDMTTENEAVLIAWRDHYGNIAREIIPPLHDFYREAFERGIRYAEWKASSDRQRGDQWNVDIHRTD